MNDKSEVSNQKNTNKVIYIGSDAGFWSTLTQKLNESYKQLNFEFESLSRSTGMEIQSLILTIRKERPKLIFVDFSTYTSEMLHIVRILSRLNGAIKPSIIGLVDYKQGDIPIQRSALAGLKCCHIKSAELDALVYDSICFAYPSALEDHGFAMAKLEDDITAFVPCMVGLLSPGGVRIESDFPMSVGSTYYLHTHWYKKGILKTPEVQCATISSEDLYYNYKYAQEFGFEYVSEPEVHDDMEPDHLEQIKQEYNFLVNQSKELMYDWVEANQNKSSPKNLKILIIDKELSFYNNQPLSDDYPFVIRCQPYLVKVKEEIVKTSPQMIVFHMEDVSNEELEANEDIAYTYNESRTLQYLIKNINTIENYNPFIIVFNSEGHDTEKLQKVLNYKQIIAHKEKLTPELVLKMAKLLESRLNANIETYDVPVVYLQKDHPASYAEIEIHMTIVACSENDLYFNCEHELEVGTVLRVNLPAPMYISVAEAPGKSKIKSQFYAVIHGIGEVEKKELRRFINGVFFRAHEEKKRAEKEEFEKLNQKTIEARQKAEAEQKAKEEAEKKAQEDAKLELERQKERDKNLKSED